MFNMFNEATLGFNSSQAPNGFYVQFEDVDIPCFTYAYFENGIKLIESEFYPDNWDVYKGLSEVEMARKAARELTEKKEQLLKMPSISEVSPLLRKLIKQVAGSENQMAFVEVEDLGNKEGLYGFIGKDEALKLEEEVEKYGLSLVLESFIDPQAEPFLDQNINDAAIVCYAALPAHFNLIDKSAIAISVPVARTVYTTVEVKVPSSCKTQQDVLDYISAKVAGGELDEVIDTEWMRSPDGDDWCIEAQTFEALNKNNEAYSSLPAGGSVTPEKMNSAIEQAAAKAAEQVKPEGQSRASKEER